MRPDDNHMKFANRETSFKRRSEAAILYSRQVSVDTLASFTPDQLADSITERFCAKRIEIHWDSFEIKSYEVGAYSKETSEPPSEATNRLQVELLLRADGAADALNGVSNGGRGVGDRYWISISLQLDPSATEKDFENFEDSLRELKTRWLNEVEKARIKANIEIDSERTKLREDVFAAIKSRSVPIRALSRAAQSLGVPLNQSEGSRIEIPATPKELSLEALSSTNSDVEEYELSSTISDSIVRQIANFGAALGRLPRAADRLIGNDEEGIRDILLFILNSNWENRVTGETFVGQGKTDLHMSWKGREAFIGECKIWAGPKRFRDAIEQLLGRYTVWNATHVALIVFIRGTSDFTSVIEKAEAEIQNHSRYHALASKIHGNVTTVHMTAQKDQRRLVKLSFIPVVVPEGS